MTYVARQRVLCSSVDGASDRESEQVKCRAVFAGYRHISRDNDTGNARYIVIFPERSTLFSGHNKSYPTFSKLSPRLTLYFKESLNAYFTMLRVKDYNFMQLFRIKIIRISIDLI